MGRVRVYSHAWLTWAAARRLGPPKPGVAAWAAAGATLPDASVAAGAVWLGARRLPLTRRGLHDEACQKPAFAGPDAALHSALPVGVSLALLWTLGGGTHHRKTLAFLLGWAGHVLADAFTHAEDARPVLWPLSRRRLRSPVSYWEPSWHARLFAVAEHAVLLLAAYKVVARGPRRPRSSVNG